MTETHIVGWWIHNVKSNKKASIYGTMNVLTCKYHDGDDANMMIHECGWKHHLPSDQPDQNFQVLT